MISSKHYNILLCICMWHYCVFGEIINQFDHILVLKSVKKRVHGIGFVPSFSTVQAGSLTIAPEMKK